MMFVRRLMLMLTLWTGLITALMIGGTFPLGCGGGSSPAPPPGDNVLHPFLPVLWYPTTYSDNVTPLDPYRDLKFWRIYALNVEDNQAWFGPENEVANVACIDNTGDLLQEFNLHLLCPHLPKGEYLLNVRVVTMSGAESPFADNTILWRNE